MLNPYRLFRSAAVTLFAALPAGVSAQEFVQSVPIPIDVEILACAIEDSVGVFVVRVDNSGQPIELLSEKPDDKVSIQDGNIILTRDQSTLIVSTHRILGSEGSKVLSGVCSPVAFDILAALQPKP